MPNQQNTDSDNSKSTSPSESKTQPNSDQILLFSKNKKIEIRGETLFVDNTDITESLNPKGEDVDLVEKAKKNGD